LAVLGPLLLFTGSLSFPIVTVLIVGLVGIVGRVAAAIDAARVVRPKPSWKMVLEAKVRTPVYETSAYP
jgi:hypothetical protein